MGTCHLALKQVPSAPLSMCILQLSQSLQAFERNTSLGHLRSPRYLCTPNATELQLHLQ